jgi:uncharacterized phiE125 gp8 family phage protein
MARYALFTAPTLHAITVEEVCSQTNVTNTEDFAYIYGLVLKAEDYYQKRTSRQLLTATWKMYFDEFPDEIEIYKLPVASISSIAYVDENGTTQTLSASAYQTDLTNSNQPARIMPAYGYSWPDTRADTFNAVTVTFVAGDTAAANVPQIAKHALLLLVAHWYEQREPVNVGNIVSPLPFQLEAMLAIEDWNQTA